MPDLIFELEASSGVRTPESLLLALGGMAWVCGVKIIAHGAEILGPVTIARFTVLDSSDAARQRANEQFVQYLRAIPGIVVRQCNEKSPTNPGADKNVH